MELLKPDFLTIVWSALHLIVVGTAMFFLIRWLISKKRLSGKNEKNALLLLLIALGSSCSEPNENFSNLNSLISTHNLRVVPVTEDNRQQFLHFESIEDAHAFLNEIKLSSKKMVMDERIFKEAYKRYLGELQSGQLTGKTKQNQSQAWPTPTGTGEPGTGNFSQTYAPWNSISVSLTWDSNGTLTLINSDLTGFTLGVSWEQSSWQQISQTDGMYTFSITYQISYNIFVEGVGTVWTSEYQTAQGDYNPATGEGHLYEPQD